MRKNIPAARRFFFEGIFLRIDLDAPALVAHVNEHGLAHLAVRGDAPGDSDFGVFDQFAFFKFRAGFARRRCQA